MVIRVSESLQVFLEDASVARELARDELRFDIVYHIRGVCKVGEILITGIPPEFLHLHPWNLLTEGKFRTDVVRT